MGLFKSIKKAVKKVAKVALPVAGIAGLGYLGASALGITGAAGAGAAAGAAGAAGAASGSSGLGYALAGLGAVNSALGVYQSKKSEQYAEDNLQAQIDWQQYAATHAHQWEMEDLKNAGLNPILTATGGSGASVSQINPQMPDLSGYGQGVNNAINLLSAYNNLRMQDSQIALLKSNTLKTLAETGNLRIVGQHTAKQIEELDEVITKLRWENSHFSTETGKAAEDINRYFGNTTAGLILKVLLGLQADQPNKPNSTTHFLQGGN